MDGQYIVFAIICGEAMAVWAKLDFCGEGKCNAKLCADFRIIGWAAVARAKTRFGELY